MNVYEESLKLHEAHHGKLTVEPKVPCETAWDLSLAYTPGVAQPCLEIQKDPENAYRYTGKGNTVAVITDGTAVLGLGDIGPTAGLPVMEGKALLMKRFAGLDAWPICLDTKDPDEIVDIVKKLAPSFGAVNLEDISAPRCVYIERRLIEECSIPVFHDDQHGTAIAVLAALLNAMKVKKAEPKDMKVVISGAGAAGSSIIRMLYKSGFQKIYAFDKDGCLDPDDSENYDPLKIRTAPCVKGDDRLHEPRRRGLPDGKPGAGDHLPGGKGGGGLYRRHRPLRLPEPGQQRTGIPRPLPRCPGLSGNQDH